MQMRVLRSHLTKRWSGNLSPLDGVLIVEEGSPGGFSAHLLQYMANEGLLMQGSDIKVAQIADDYIDHDSKTRTASKAGY